MSKEETIQQLQADNEVLQNTVHDLTATVRLRDEQLADQQRTTRTVQAQWGNEVENLKDNVARAVVQFGEEHDSCLDGMTAFLAEALGIDAREAESRLKSFMSREITVTISATVFGAEHDHITRDEAHSFLAEALGADEVEDIIVELDGLR